MITDLSTSQLMKRWDCSRQNVSQLMKRHGIGKLYRTGYNNEARYSMVGVRYVESVRKDMCRP